MANLVRHFRTWVVGRRRNRRGRERGQALVEAALVSLVLLVTLIAVFDMAQVFFIHQTLTERVRTAARYGISRTFDADAVRNMVLYNQPSVPPSGSPLFGLTPDMVSATRTGAGTTDDRIVIQIVNYPYRLLTPLIAGPMVARPIIVSLPYEMQ